MPGYLVAGQCIGDSAVAAEVWASVNFPKFVPTSTYMYVHAVSGITGTTVSVAGSCVGTCAGVSPISYSVPANLRSCDPLEYPSSIFQMGVTDGGLVGAAVAGVWVAAYALRAVRRVLGSGGAE